MAQEQLLRTVSRFAGFLAVIATAACAAKEEPAPPPPATPPVITVKASDFSYSMPSEVQSGFTTFKLVNDGPNLHHMIIAFIDSGKTFDDAKAALAKHAPPPTWIVPVGGPNAPEPTMESNATLDLKVGNYVVFCMVDIPGGVPHVAKGMINSLKVVQSTGPAVPAPKADLEIALSDFVFGVAGPITAGPHTIAVTTNPGQAHELEIIKFAPGKSMDDFMKDMEAMMSGKPMKGPMSGVAVGGTAPAVEKTTQYFTVNFTPGDYALICFIPDKSDGKMHLEHGMIKQFTIQ